MLKVGPESAGARPGPACYGHGGVRPTVTDAYVCLGIIAPDRFLGGTVQLDAGLAHDAIARLGETLGLDVTETAEAILRVATSQMYSALVPLMARKGIDYEDYTLLAFGGGGPCHAFLLADNVGIRRVMVPLHPGTLCAAGALAADVRKDLVHTVHAQLSDPGPVLAAVEEAVERLAVQGEQWLDSLGLDLAGRRQEWVAELRYVGQSFEIPVPIDAAVLADRTGNKLRHAFHDLYRQIYGHADEEAELEILDVRASVIGVTPKPSLPPLPPPSGGPPHEGRSVFLDGKSWHAQVFDRAALAPGFTFHGPAIVEQYDTTVLVTPGFRVTVDAHGNLIGEATDAS